MTDADRKSILEKLAKSTAEAKTMSRAAARQRLIAEGIYTEDGRLAARYGGKVAAATA